MSTSTDPPDEGPERGEIWWADLGAAVGSAPAKRRPVAIVSSDRFNRSAINTVVVVSITSNLRLADAPGNVLLDPDDTGLERASVLNVSQIATVDRSMLIAPAGRLDAEAVARLDAGLRLALDLS